MPSIGRVNKSVSFTVEEAQEVTEHLESIGRPFSKYAREAIREKMEREDDDE